MSNAWHPTCSQPAPRGNAPLPAPHFWEPMSALGRILVGASDRNAAQTRLWPEVCKSKTACIFRTASSTRDRKTLLLPEASCQIWWRESDDPHLRACASPLTKSSAQRMCCSEGPVLGYVMLSCAYLWGTQVWGWGRYPWLNHPWRRLGSEQMRTYAHYVDLTALPLDCVLCVSFSLHIRLRATAWRRRSQFVTLTKSQWDG